MFKNEMFKGEMLQAQVPTLFKLTAEQRQAIVDDLLRSFVMQKRLYRQCPDRRCRRLRTCGAADRPCLCSGSLPPMSNKDAKRLKRDFKHNPPRG